MGNSVVHTGNRVAHTLVLGGKCRKKKNQSRYEKMEKSNEIIQNVEFKITSETVLFFDMDGTLIDTTLANFLSYKKAILSVTKSEHDLTYDSMNRFNRSNLRTAIPNLEDNEYEEIVQEKEKLYNDFLHETELNIEIVKILTKYSGTNKTVLVTNCREDRALKTLNYHGLTDKFTNIFFRQHADNGKKINKFENATIKLGVPPNLIVIFENEEVEIVDAKKIGIEIINPKIA